MATRKVIKSLIKATSKVKGNAQKVAKKAIESTPVKTPADEKLVINEVQNLQNQEKFIQPKVDVQPQAEQLDVAAKAEGIIPDTKPIDTHPKNTGNLIEQDLKDAKKTKLKDVPADVNTDPKATSDLENLRNNIFEDSEVKSRYGEERIKKLKENPESTIKDVKSQIFKGYSIIRSKVFKDIIDKSDSFKRVLGDRNKLNTAGKGVFYHKVLTASLSVEEKHRYFSSKLSNAVANKGGERAFKVLQEFHTDPARALSKYGYEERDLFKAMRSPDDVDDPILKSIGDAFREMDKEYVDYVKGLSLLGEVEKYIVPLIPSDTVLRSLGKEGYAALLLKSLDGIDETQALAVAEKVLKNSRGKNLYSIKVNPGSGRDFFSSFGVSEAQMKKVKFKSVDHEYDFVKAITGKGDSEVSVLAKALEHKELQLTKAFMFAEFGADPRETIRNTFDHIINKYTGKDKVELAKALTNSEEYLVKTIELAMGKGYQESNTFRLYMEALSKYISAAFGSPASFVRQLFTDTTGQSLTLSKALIDDSTLPGHIHSKMFKPLQTLLTVAATGGSKSPLRKELTNLLQVFEFSTNQNSLFKGMGVKMESFFGAMTLESSGSKLDDLGVTLNNFAAKFNGFINDVSGNSLHFDTVSLVNTWNTANAFSRLVFTKNWDDYSKALGNKLHHLTDMFGIGQDEFNALKRVPKVQIDAPNLQKHLGLKKGDGIILPSEIKNMPDDVAKKYKQKHETVDSFKSRLERSYFSLLLDERQNQQVTVTRANRFVARGLNKGTAVEFLLRPFTQFSDISNEQYQAIKRGLSVSLYGNPWELGHLPKSKSEFLQGWGRAYAFYTSFGLGVLWAKDMLAGRQPSKLSKNTMFQASTTSGVMGIPGMVFSSLAFGQKGFYGNTPYGGLVNTIGKSRKGSYNTFKAAQRASGVGKLWWAAGTADYLAKQSLLSEDSRREMDLWYKRHTGSGNVASGKK